MGTYKNNNETLEPIAGATFYADNPIGTILAFGGSDIPVGWHLCDGTAVSRTAYAELFAIIGTTFGVGDGSTTFNLPDLQGEFLRGAGTNSHSGQGDGGAVGEHQDATVHVGVNASSDYMAMSIYPTAIPNNADSELSTSIGRLLVAKTTNDSNGGTFTSRPTNTSVNYIIKMKPVMFPSDVLSQIGDALSYSTAEKLTGGRWIDGKPIYQKTIDCGALPNNTLKRVAHGISNIDAIIKVSGSAYNDNHNGFSIPIAENNSNYSIYVDKDGDDIRIQTAADRSSVNHSYITIQYTKTTD